MSDHETRDSDARLELAEERVERRKARRREEVDAYEEDVPAEESPRGWRTRLLYEALRATRGRE